MKGNLSNIEAGLLYGIIFGAAAAVILYSFTEQTLSFYAVGVGLVAGLIIGGSMPDKKAKASKKKK